MEDSKETATRCVRELPGGVLGFCRDHPYCVAAGATVTSAALLHLLLRRYIRGRRCTSKVSMEGKTVIITGANCGIGFETAKDLAARGARVLLACRDMQKAENAAEETRRTTGNGNVEVYYLNLANITSIRSCVKEILQKEERIDVLINNAGVVFADPSWTTDDGFEIHMGTNHLGHFLFTNLLLDKIKQSAPSRIINVSSLAHSDGVLDFDDISSPIEQSRWAAYSRSKLALILFTKELQERLKGTGVTVYSLHPGIVKTNFDRHMPSILRFVWDCQYFLGGLQSPEEGAQTSIYCAVEEGIEKDSGKYFSDCAVKEPNHPMTRDPQAARQLWDVSAKLVGLSLGDVTGDVSDVSE